MITLYGKGASKGVAIGDIFYLERSSREVQRKNIDDTDAEVMKLESAREQSINQLMELIQSTTADVGEENAQIFEIHQMLLQDEDFNNCIIDIIISEKVCAEYAVRTAGKTYAEMFSSMEDEYMKARAADIKDIASRLIAELTGEKQTASMPEEPFILAADDLTPSETVQLDKSKILAFVTEGGSNNSHTAILAGIMGIPAVVAIGAALERSLSGKGGIVDGGTGTVIIEPDETTLEKFSEKAEQELAEKRMLDTLRGQSNTTQDGQTLEVYANIGGVDDTASALANEAEGIGLLRSEFLYLSQDDYPTEEQQYQAYKRVVEDMKGKKVVIRTLDIGADKKIGYFDLPEEENPALGYRAIRICLERPEIFKTQLRAIYRASAFGKVAIMFPMIISVEEIKAIKIIVEAVKEELYSEEIMFSENVELGIMVETPASAINSDLLAEEVDFFSIGTNDLTQYTLAIDRQNDRLAPFYRADHRAVLRLINHVIDNAHKAGIWVGICGELASDLSLTETFLAMGIDELSVSAPNILPLRKKIRDINVSEIRKAVLDNII